MFTWAHHRAHVWLEMAPGFPKIEAFSFLEAFLQLSVVVSAKVAIDKALWDARKQKTLLESGV